MPQEYQIKKLNHLFRIIDFDHNGLLQKSDFEGIADNISIFTGIIDDQEKDLRLHAEVECIWQLITDHSGEAYLDFIDLDQWITFIKVHFFDPNEEQIDRNIGTLVNKIREIFDKNNDVQISRLEFMSIFVSFRVEVRFADQCFKAIDSNSDGYISEEELLQAAMEFFKDTEPGAAGNFLFGDPDSAHFATRRALY